MKKFFLRAVPATFLAGTLFGVAISQLGVKENPEESNSGPEVNEYLASTNTAPGNPWCAAFCFWRFKRAAGNGSVPNPVVKTAHVLTHWRDSVSNPHARRIRKAEVVANPALVTPGMLLIYN